MTTKQIRPFGTWDSPVTPQSLANVRELAGLAWDSDGRSLLWLEQISGQGVLFCESGGAETPRQLPLGINIRAEVGYGGGDFTVHAGAAYCVEKGTGRLWRAKLAGGAPVAVTPEKGSAASPAVSPDGRFVILVHEDTDQTGRLLIVPSDGSQPAGVLDEQAEFYMQPRWSPCGTRLAWVAWDRPNMPWDGTWLYVAKVEHNERGLPTLREIERVAGGQDVASFQPEFSADGRSLYYVSDESGWGRIAERDLESGEVRWLTPEGVEHAKPAWSQGLRTYAIAGERLFAVQNSAGRHTLWQIDLSTGGRQQLSDLAEYTHFNTIAAAPQGDRLAMIAGNSTTSPQVVEYVIASGSKRVVKESSVTKFSPAALASAEPIAWPTAEGDTAHGLFYAPASDRYTGEGRPPLVVLVHGGPTAQRLAAWSGEAQFFATRGYAVLDVNYRGSTGYGRAYMLRLRGNWGVCDVEDVSSGVAHLTEQELVDPQRTVIMGGSAGGFTVLQTMCTHPTAFTAGVNLYGVANQFHLAEHTHKFESRYLDTMLGPLPDAADIYHARSPELHADRIRRPLAIYQGELDRVVPRAQSDAIAAALQLSGTPFIYHVYPNEGHGWRHAENIVHFYSTVEAFLREHVLTA